MSCYQLQSSLGFSVTKKNNIDLIEDDKLLFIVGNTIQILNINSTQNNYGKFNDNHIVIHGHSDGIGAFAIDGNKKHIAFGEIGHSPDVYIYSYPELRQVQKLSNGTQRAFSDMEFNVTGNYLATIGASPDHMLTIWDWQIGSVILRAKAFSQDVFNVRFSPYNKNRLITSGTGHIRFWEMAQTFTGLKLQGAIGKFGSVDLSDVWCFVEFESGKILSGSEHGNILMWQTDLIQFVAKPDEDTQCHQSNIIYVDIYGDGLISAGTDGWIKFWECHDIEYFEPSDDLTYYPLQLTNEIKVNTKCKLIKIIKYGDLYWIIQDAMGNIYKLLNDEEYTLRSVVQFHGIYVTSIECGDKSHDMITSGKDGNIRHWNLETQKCDFIKNIRSSINLLLPLSTYYIVFCDDGVVRIIEKGIDSFLIKYSLRLHDEPIALGVISDNSTYLATITEKQLFFSEITLDPFVIQPIGFVLLKHRLNKLYWSKNNNYLCSYYKQDIIIYQRPSADQFDTSASFEIELNPMMIHVTPFLTEQDTKEKEKEKKEEEEEAEEKGNIFDRIEWEISCILPWFENDSDLLIAVSFPNNESLTIPNYYRWNIEVNKIVEFKPTHFESDYINSLSYSKSKQLLLISTQQNMIEIRDIYDDEIYVQIRIHNICSSIPNLISMSYDDRLLISSSSDGSLFCHLFDPNKLKRPGFDVNFDIEYMSVSDIKSIKHVTDISDHTANDYSVQGEKIQREIDNAKSDAEKYKSELRQQLNTIRNRKKEILAKAKPCIENNLGLTISDLDIDENLRIKMRQELQEDKKQTETEMGAESEKVEIALNQLENAFLKRVLVENIEICSFRSLHSVSTFRTPVLPEWIRRDIASVHEIINNESSKVNVLSKEDGNVLNSVEEKDDCKNESKPLSRIMSASQQKKIIREKLKQSLEELQNEKPDENADDPRDIRAIKFATKNIGDYKLKSDSNYIVPSDQHINASQKRKQMILLLESVNYIKMGLNERVLALRDLKKRIIENITADTSRLNEINGELDIQREIKPPTVDVLKEWPQERYNYTKQDLCEFSRIKQQELDAKSGNNNAFGGAQKKTAKKKQDTPITSINNTYKDRLNRIEKSELEKRQLMKKRSQLSYEKGVLLDKINSTINTFDNAVSELREEKYKLMNDLKLTDLKFLTLLKELSVLKTFEEREVSLNGKLLKCRTEKAQVVVDLTETQERLSSKLDEIRLWQTKDKKISQQFDHIVGERNPFHDELKKIFGRKIKRNKRSDNADSDADSDDDSSCDSDDDSDKNDYDDKNDCDDSCPKDCDNLIYEKVMELREKRLDQEEILIEFEKAVDDLKSSNLSLINREKNIDKNLFETEKEIELFQTEKQQELNKIIVTVPMLLSQIRTKDTILPQSIDDLLIFELKSLDNLKNRIFEQKKEKIEIKKEYTELKKLHKSLTKKINIKQSNIDVEKRKCEQVQFLKYGRLVSLEVLDANNVMNPETFQLQKKLDKITAQYKNKYNLWDLKLNETKKELKKIIIQNTNNIEILTQLKSKQNNLHAELNNILDVDVIKDNAPSNQKRNHELQKLVQVAKTQANEIDVLKAEIHILQRKGGMVYAMPEN